MCRIQTAPGSSSKLLIEQGLRMRRARLPAARGSRSCACSRVSRSCPPEAGRMVKRRRRCLQLDRSYDVEPPSSRKCTAFSLSVPAPSSRRPRVDARVWCRRSAIERLKRKPLPVFRLPLADPPATRRRFRSFSSGSVRALQQVREGVEMTSRTLQRASALAALVWILAVPVLAQSGTSTISGVVRDSTDAPLPGATVKVVNEDTGVAIETVSNAEGLYRVPALVPGHYRVEIHLEGFDLAIRRPITLEVSQTLAVDAVLSVGKQSETVNVSSETPLVIESQSSNIAQTVTRQMLDGAAAAEPCRFVAGGAGPRRGHDRHRAPARRRTTRCFPSPAAGRATRTSSSTAATRRTPSA